LSRYLCQAGLTLLATAFLLAVGAGQALAQEEPSIVITAPAEGEVLPGPDITVTVDLSGFTMSLPEEPKREPNKGHIAYFLDIEPSFHLPTPLGDDNIIHSGRLSETFVGVPDGEHAIYVCLVYDDNTCMDPALTDSVRVSVGAPPPTATRSSEATPTPEPPQETPTPLPPTPSPTEQPPPPETPVQAETPPASPATQPPTPSLTTQPPTAVPPTPAATPAPGMAPSTSRENETRLSVWYAGVAAVVALIVAGALALWWMERSRGRR
jgi:hypothetical protein